MNKDKQLEKIAKEFAKNYLSSDQWKYAESLMIKHFVDKVVAEGYFGKDDVATVWNQEEDAFDVMYDARFGHKTFYVSMYYVEYLNETEKESAIASELMNIIIDIENDITYLKQYEDCTLGQLNSCVQPQDGGGTIGEN